MNIIIIIQARMGATRLPSKMMKDISIEDQNLFAYKMEHWKATEIARTGDDNSNVTDAEDSEERLVFTPQDIHSKETNAIQSQFD